MIKEALKAVGYARSPKRTFFLLHPVKSAATLATWKTAKVAGAVGAGALAVWGGKRIFDAATAPSSSTSQAQA